MSVIRTVHNRENPFVQLNKEALWNEKLSLKAIGLWARCMSRPTDWRFNVKELVSKSKEGRRAIDSAINELIANDYAVRLEHWEKDQEGKFTTGGVEYVFFEFPATKEDKEKVLEEFKKCFRHCGFGDCRNGDCRNAHLLIEKETEKEKEEELSCPRSETDAVTTQPKKAELPPKEEKGTEPKALEMAQDLLKRVLAVYPKYKAPKIESWTKEMDLMHRRDNRSWEEIKEVIRYAFEEDSFWPKVIQSPTTLRKNFDKIAVKMKPVENKASGKEQNMEYARKVKGYLNSNGKGHRILLQNNGIVHQNSGDSIGYDLPTERFKEIILKWAELNDKGG